MPRRTGGVLLTCAVVTGGLLTGCGDSLEPEEGDLPLVGTTWAVEAYDLGDGTTQPPEDAEATVLLSADNNAELRTGCNTADARFDAGSGTISFRLTGSTEVGCADDVLDLEEALRTFYAHDQLKWAVAGDRLILEVPESRGSDWVDLRGEPAQATG